MERTGTVDKAVDLLFHLHECAGPVGVTALGRASTMPKASVHRLVNTLARKGLVERDDRGRYQPGANLVALGLGVLDRGPTVACAQAVLPDFVDRAGETMFLVGARARSLIVLHKCEGTGLLRASPRIGSEVPVATTAAGALYMAHAHEEFYPVEIAAGADTDVAWLQERAAAAKRDGWSANHELWQAGLSVIAAPVVVRGRMRAAVALAASAARLQALGGDALAPLVVEAANRIAERAQGAWS